VTLPNPAEVEHADWPALKTFAAELGLNPKGRSGLVRQRVLDHLRTQPRGPEWRAGKAEQAALLTRIGAADIAATLWESTITLDAPAPWVGLGTAYAKAGRIEEALKCYDRAISMGDAGARLHKANVLMVAGRSDAAAAEVEATLAANPGNVRAWAVRAVISEASGDPEEARASHAKIAGLGRAHLGLAKILMRAGRFEEAETALAEHLTGHPEDAVAWNQRGVCLVKRGSWREAVEALRKAAALRPRDAGILNNLAVALAGAGRVDEALKRTAAARRIAEDPRILLNEAALLEGKNRLPEARALVSRVLHIAPGHMEAVEAARRIAPERRAARLPSPPPAKKPAKASRRAKTRSRSKRSRSPAKRTRIAKVRPRKR
jgi:tetratricopeptide (TPR) repeat protein